MRPGGLMKGVTTTILVCVLVSLLSSTTPGLVARRPRVATSPCSPGTLDFPQQSTVPSVFLPRLPTWPRVPLIPSRPTTALGAQLSRLLLSPSLPLFLRADAAAAASRSFTVCAFAAEGGATTIALAVKHAVWYYTHGPGANASRAVVAPTDVFGPTALPTSRALASFDWHTRLIGSGSFAAGAYVRTWVAEEAKCDALVGPAYSFLAVAVSPVVDGVKTAWVDPFATSAALSSPSDHPSFSRVTSTSADKLVSVAQLFQRFQWADLNAVFVDEPYARAVASGALKAMAAINGTVFTYRSLPTELSESQFVAVMDFIAATSPSRVILVAALADVELRLIIATIKARRYDESFIFLFTDFCTDSSLGIADLKSALCVMNTYNKTLAKGFLSSYQQRNTWEDMALLRALPAWNMTGYDAAAPSFLLPQSHDATLHAMRSLVYANATGVRRVTSVRSITTQALSGGISLDVNGERPMAYLIVLNAQASGLVPVGFLDVNGVSFCAPDETPVTAVPTLRLLGKAVENGAVPGSRVPSPQDSKGLSTTAVVGITAGGVAIVAIGVVCTLVLVFQMRSNARDNSNAPKDPTKPFAIVFTDIQASTALWARVPEQMSEAVDVHHATIRRLIARHHGYEVKTIGDSFMVAFHDAKDAVAFSMEVQIDLYVLDWHPAIDTTYDTVASDHRDCSWNGLRVRVGAHYGLGKIQQDPVTQGFDYYGTVVNTAARVEAVGHGGQTLVTAAVLEAVSGTVPGAEASDLGAQPLRGLSEPVWLHQLLPTDLADRLFPELRLAIEIDDDGLEDMDQSHSSCTHNDDDRSIASVTHHGTDHGSAVGASAGQMSGADVEVEAMALRIAKRRHRGAISSGLSVPPSRDTSGAGPKTTGPTAPLSFDDPPSSLPSLPSAQQTAWVVDTNSTHTGPKPEMVALPMDRDQQDIVLLASFLRKLLSVVPAKERQRAVAQYAKRWHAKVTTAQEVRGRQASHHTAAEKYRADIADSRTLMSLVERVWLTLDR